MQEEQYFKANRHQWDQRVPIHLQSDFYDVAGFRNGNLSLTQIELEGLGSVRGKRLLHLQCHFGMDTLSWARLGAEVTGVDFSAKAVEEAIKLSEELNLPARFIEANVYDLPDLLNEEFDVVFTSFGAIVWLPDLLRWADIVHRFLARSGTFYIAEFHPALYIFDFDTGSVAYNYFNTGVYEEKVEKTYAGSGEKIAGTEYFWNHSISEVLTPLLNKGLALISFREFDYSPYACFPNMVERGPHKFIWDIHPQRLPHVYSLKMVKIK